MASPDAKRAGSQEPLCRMPAKAKKEPIHKSEHPTLPFGGPWKRVRGQVERANCTQRRTRSYCARVSLVAMQPWPRETIRCFLRFKISNLRALRGATGITLQRHQAIGLTLRRAFQFFFTKTTETLLALRGQYESDRSMIQPCSSNDPTMNPPVRNRQRKWYYFRTRHTGMGWENAAVRVRLFSKFFQRSVRLARRIALESPHIPLATKHEPHNWCPQKNIPVTQETSSTLRAATQITCQPHPLVCPPQ